MIKLKKQSGIWFLTINGETNGFRELSTALQFLERYRGGAK